MLFRSARLSYTTNTLEDHRVAEVVQGGGNAARDSPSVFRESRPGVKKRVF